MAKRFIDTNIFSDEWFSELSKDGKLFFIYFFTQCDHAGVLNFNKKLCIFQTGIDSPERVIEEFGNSLVRVGQGSTYFMPKYITFQYPGFPKSNVAQQDSAIKILKNLNLWDEKKNTFRLFSEESPKTYVNVNDNGNDNAYVRESLGSKTPRRIEDHEELPF